MQINTWFDGARCESVAIWRRRIRRIRCVDASALSVKACSNGGRIAARSTHSAHRNVLEAEDEGTVQEGDSQVRVAGSDVFVMGATVVRKREDEADEANAL